MRSLARFGLLLTLVLATRGLKAEDRRRGPLEWRDEFLLTQTRLALRARPASLLRPGRVRVRVLFDWGNDFGWNQEPPGEMPEDRRFLVDGEHRGFDLDVSMSPGERWEVGLLLPYRWRGGGVLDGVIDWWHGVVAFLPDNLRSRFDRDLLRVDGRSDAFEPIEWQGGAGGGLGNLALRGRFAVADARGDPVAWSWTVGAELAVPTGTGPFAGNGIDFGLETQTAKRIGDAWDLHLGAGVTRFGTRELSGISYQQNRGFGFAALEWHVARRLSLIVQLDGATRLVQDIARFPASHVYLRIGAKLDVSERWMLEGGFTENIKHQQATTDFSITLGLAREF